MPAANGRERSRALPERSGDGGETGSTTCGGHARRARRARRGGACGDPHRNDGDNRLIGSNQRDSISGGGGEDLIKGLRAVDSLNGGAGGDDIYAGPRDEQARDTVVAAGGNDFIKVFNRPAAKDVVHCGDGRDRVIADSKDVLSGCEQKRRR